MAIEKIKILGAVMELLPIQSIHQENGPNGLNWQCYLAGSSKTAPRILIFSMAMGADYTFELISIKTCAPQFKWHNKSFPGSVPKHGRKTDIFDPLRPSSCPRSYWMAPEGILLSALWIDSMIFTILLINFYHLITKYLESTEKCTFFAIYLVCLASKYKKENLEIIKCSKFNSWRRKTLNKWYDLNSRLSVHDVII